MRAIDDPAELSKAAEIMRSAMARRSGNLAPRDDLMDRARDFANWRVERMEALSGLDLTSPSTLTEKANRIPPSQPSPDHGWVYFIGELEAQTPIKIGMSNNPDNRLGHINTSSFVKMSILALVEADDMRALERVMHVRFQDSRAHREWFNRTPELMDLIDSIKAEDNA